jgi:hypothetical protein
MIGTNQNASPLPPATPLTSPLNTSVAMNQTLPPTSDSDKTAADKTSPKPTALDKYNTVAGALSSSVQKGLSYANARREREKYKA